MHVRCVLGSELFIFIHEHLHLEIRKRLDEKSTRVFCKGTFVLRLYHKYRMYCLLRIERKQGRC